MNLGDTPAVDCPGKQSDSLCDCGDKICDYIGGEYLDPASCNCKKGVSKRSVSKRYADDNDLNNNPKPNVIVPHGKNLDLKVPKKRSIH